MCNYRNVSPSARDLNGKPVIFGMPGPVIKIYNSEGENMETRKKKTLLVGLLCLMLAAFPMLWAAGTASAGEGGGHGRGGHHGPFQMLKKLNLTDAQKHDVAVILKENRDQVRNLATQMAGSREKIFSLVGGADYNEAALRQAAQDVSKLHEEMIVLRAQIAQKIRGVLTADQLAKLDAMRARFGGKMEKRMDRGFDRMDQWIDKYSS